jgi:hypothetical protein
VLVVAFGSHYALLVGVDGSLIVAPLLATTVTRWGHRFCPFLPPLAPFLAPLAVALVGVVLPPSVAAAVLPRTKAAPTASSPEACQVAMSSSSLVVFAYSQLS